MIAALRTAVTAALVFGFASPALADGKAAGRLQFTIEAHHLKQRFIEKPPWFEDNPPYETWTTFDATSAGGTHFVIGIARPVWYDWGPPDRLRDVVVAFGSVADLAALVVEVDPKATAVDANSQLAAKAWTGWQLDAGDGTGTTTVALSEREPAKRSSPLTLGVSLETRRGEFAWKTPADRARLVQLLVDQVRR